MNATTPATWPLGIERASRILADRNRDSIPDEEQDVAGYFDGEAALVTGAGSGIGRASARAFAREGTSVPRRYSADPDALAEAVIWLCSSRASYVSGESMLVDDGAICR